VDDGWIDVVCMRGAETGRGAVLDALGKASTGGRHVSTGAMEAYKCRSYELQVGQAEDATEQTVCIDGEIWHVPNGATLQVAIAPEEDQRVGVFA